jgi:hypothetical protein
MDQALAAIQLGYLSRELRFQVDRVWYEHPFKPHRDIAPTLSAVDGCLNALSNRMDSDQRTRATNLLTQIATRHDGVCEYMAAVAFKEIQKAERGRKTGHLRFREIIEEDGGQELWQRDQRQDWTALSNLLQAIVRPGSRLAAWFEIGDHLADIRGQLGTQYITELDQKNLAYLSSGVEKLRFPEKEEVRHFFTVVRIRPGQTPSALAFFKQIERTYQRLCWLIENRDLQAKPIWDGAALSYRGKFRPWKRQKGAKEKKEVVGPILDELQKQDWLEFIEAPEAIKDGDVTQALSRFSKTAPIRLWFGGSRIYWEPASFPRQRKRGGRPKGKRGSGRTSD